MPEDDVRRLLGDTATKNTPPPPVDGVARARRTARTRMAARVAGTVVAVAIVVSAVPVAVSLAGSDRALQPQPAGPAVDRPMPAPSDAGTVSPSTAPTPTPTTLPKTTGPRTVPPAPPQSATASPSKSVPTPAQPGAGSLDGYVSLVESGSDPQGTSVTRDPFWPVDACRDQVGIDGTNLPDGVLDAYRVTHNLGDGGAQVVVVVLPDEATAATVLADVDDGIARCGDPATAPDDATGNGTWTIVERGGYGDDALLVHVDYFPTQEAIAAGASPEVWEERNLVVVRSGNVMMLWETYAMTSAAGHVHDVPAGVRTQAADELAHLQAHLG
jgi:hypothetical protein